MKTIILYATKHGAAAEIARRIADKIEGAGIYNLKQGNLSLDYYDNVIIGSSIYAGMIRKEAKTFISQNIDILKDKKLGLFICGLSASGDEDFFKNNFPAELLEAAKVKSFLGGIFDPKKANALERFIIKLVSKKSIYVDTINDRKIEQFVQAIN